jgi:ADP-dependent NAD(P)H-hydrate dehydratase / NAD(P)H-hydrate epimerase
MEKFDPKELKKLYQPANNSTGEDNGQVVIIGGSSLFHGAPLFALKVASRIVDMVFFASPEPSVGKVAEQIKSKLFSFIWVPWDEIDRYIEKSDAVLIGPGFMRFKSESIPHGERNHVCDEACQITKNVTERLLKKFPDKKWVIDAGSLQTLDPSWIPQNSILTPNIKEFELLFKLKSQNLKLKTITQVSKLVQEKAKQYNCTIVYKAPETIVSDGSRTVAIANGNPGLTKGGTGDTQAGLTVALLAKNEPFLAACSASYIVKSAADELYRKVGTNYNADDLAGEIPEVLSKLKK